MPSNIRRESRIQTVSTIALWLAIVGLSLNAARLSYASWVRRAPALALTGGAEERGATSPMASLTTRSYAVYFNLDTSAPDETSPKSLRTIAVRSDGSSVQRLEVLNVKNPVASRLLILASGRVITTNDVLETKHTRVDPAAVRRMLRDPSSQCLRSFAGTPFGRDEAILSRERIGGHDTVAVKNGSLTLWLAPDLGCAEIKSRVSHPTAGTILQTATHVVAGEPPPELFDVPTRYVEVSREEVRSNNPMLLRKRVTAASTLRGDQ